MSYEDVIRITPMSYEDVTRITYMSYEDVAGIVLLVTGFKKGVSLWKF